MGVAGDYPDDCVIQIPSLKVVCISSVVIYCSMKKSRIEGTVVVLLLLVILIFVTTFFHFYVVILDVSSITSISIFLMFPFSEIQIQIFKSTTKTHKLLISGCWLGDNK